MTRHFSFIALFAAAAFAATANADNIIDEHIKAMGGADALAKLKSLEESGTASLTGPFGAFEGSVEATYDIAGSRGHTVMDLGIFRIESAWTPDAGWQDNPQTGIGDMDEEALERTKMNGPPCLAYAIKEKYGMDAFNEPTDEKFNDKDCAKVTIKESDVAFYINKETKLMEGLGISDEVTITMEEFKEIEGIQFATKTTTKIAQPEITIVNQIEETKLNGEIDAEIFAKPEPVESP